MSANQPTVPVIAARPTCSCLVVAAVIITSSTISRPENACKYWLGWKQVLRYVYILLFPE